jgi:hypothetical protein
VITAATQTAVGLRRGWTVRSAAETRVSPGVSAQRCGVLEDFRVLPVVVPPLKFRDVERQLLGAEVVEAAMTPRFSSDRKLSMV